MGRSFKKPNTKQQLGKEGRADILEMSHAGKTETGAFKPLQIRGAGLIHQSLCCEPIQPHLKVGQRQASKRLTQGHCT